MTSLGFISRALIGLLHGMKGDTVTETSLSDRSFIIILVKLREGMGDSEAEQRQPQDQCPQELCMVCG
jgi:hypothetical protein